MKKRYLFLDILIFVLPLLLASGLALRTSALIYTPDEEFKIELNARKALEKTREAKIAEIQKEIQKLENEITAEVRAKQAKARNKPVVDVVQNRNIERIGSVQKSKSLKSITLGKRAKRIKYEKFLDDEEKGVWVNLWNYPGNVREFISRQAKYGINTIYLQINRSTTDIFKHQKKVDEILKLAHRANIKVIGWSYCYLNKDIALDAKKFIEPALYVSPDGHHLDGMAADIEENISRWAISKYTELIKESLPEDYPLRAIIFAPEIKSKYPWKYIADNWDVLMPMAYWHGYTSRGKYVNVFDFIGKNIVRLKELTGKEDLKIHLITDGDRTTPEEVLESIKAAKAFKVNAGISIYPEHLASDAMLRALSLF